MDEGRPAPAVEGLGRGRPKVAEAVARRIVATIVDRGLVAGDRLPREAEMVESYGVGRETVREGLRLLETQGLINLRRGPGGGPVVAAATPVNLGRISTLYFQMVGASYRELVEAWVVAESTLAERAARNPDAGRRAELMAPYLADAPVRAEATTVENFISLHSGFHDALGELGGNRVLQLTLSSFGQIVSYQSDVVEDPRLLRQSIHDDHLRLARAVAAGHHRLARRLMREHIEGVWLQCRDQVAADPEEQIRWV